jgi:hypothetical protein
LGTRQIKPSANVSRLGYVVGVAVCVMGLPTPSAAQSAAERAACKADVFRLCAEEIPNVHRILACMRARKVRLSANCRLVFDRYGG